MLWKRVNYMILKRLINSRLDLKEDKIAWFSNDVQYRSYVATLGWKKVKLQAIQIREKNCKALKKGTQRVQIENSNHKRLVAREDRLVLTMSRG